MLKIFLHQKSLMYSQLTPIFRLHNLHLEFSTNSMCTKKTVLNAKVKDF